MLSLELADIQGNILQGYAMDFARYLLVRFADGASGRALVGQLAEQVTTAQQWPLGPDHCPLKPDSTLNIGFTLAGLQALEVPADALSALPPDFRQGMRARAARLGDTGDNAPEHWESPWGTDDVHAWISVNSPRLELLNARCHRLEQAFAAHGVRLVAAQDANQLRIDNEPVTREHFGFADGISDPDFVGAGGEAPPGNGKLLATGGPLGARWGRLAAGELLLGQPDEAAEMAPAPLPYALTRNGTFMVYRKLRQFVGAFRSFKRDAGARYPGGPELLAAKIVGRWPNGAPLLLHPHVEPKDPEHRHNPVTNDFVYGADESGVKCPLGAHIRRSNPRDALGFENSLLSNRHRIVRRGKPYGPWVPLDEIGDDAVDRGLIFIAHCASLERQFEFIQQQWLNYGNAFGLGNDPDPLVGNHFPGAKMVIQGDPSQPHGHAAWLCRGLPAFVAMRGGAYFFVPSLTALRAIARGDLAEEQPRRSSPHVSPDPERPMSLHDFFADKLQKFGHLATERDAAPAHIQQQIERELAGLETESKALADQFKNWVVEHPRPLFAALRLLKPILVLKDLAIVTRFDDVREVLAEDQVFAVTYGEKMTAIGDGRNFFLGMQNTPIYSRDVSNMRLATPRGEVATRLAPRIAEVAEDCVAAAGGRLEVVNQLARLTPARVIGHYFGLADYDESQVAAWATTLFNFLFIDQGDPEVRAKALAVAAQMRQLFDAAVAARKGMPPDGRPDDVLTRLLTMQAAGLAGLEDVDIRNNLVGLLVGAIPTTGKAVTFVVNELLDRPKELADAHAAACRGDDDTLAAVVFEALRFSPINPGLFRVAAENYELGRGSLRATMIVKGTTVLAATQSAMFDGSMLESPGAFRTDRPDWAYLHFGFGLHTCFGQTINVAQIPAIVKALFKKPGLRRAAGDAGKMRMDGAWPVSLTVEFDGGV